MRQEEIRFIVHIPEGYEFSAWRYATHGDKYLPGNGNIGHWNLTESIEKKIILKKVERWRPATPDDIVRVMGGEEVEARFRDDVDQDWCYLTLDGYRHRNTDKWYSAYKSWNYCEVKE